MFVITGNSFIASAQCCDGGDCCIQNDCYCPMCWDRGEPGGICEHCGSDLCPECGNCYECGQTPCPDCRTTCIDCGGPLCEHCGGCLDCGHGRDEDCPYCGEKNETFLLGPFDGMSPLGTIGNTDVYLFAPFGISAWIITNLIAGITGGFMLALATLRIILYKRKENKKAEAELLGLKYEEKSISSKLISVLDKIEKKYTEHRSSVFITMGILGILGIVILILTQSFNGIIAIFDWWTIIHVILFAGIIVCNRLIFIRKDDDIPSHAAFAG